MPFRFCCRLYVDDTDMGGIVYYVNCLKFFEHVRTELLRFIGFEQHCLQQYCLQLQGLIFVVSDVQCRSLQPARLDDELIVEVAIQHLSGARLLLSQQAIRVVGILLFLKPVSVS